MNNESTDFFHRYSRQIALPQVGEEGQRKLAQCKVLIVGLGGLGSPVSLYLAASGIGTLGLSEWDNVEIHNLQRQVLYDADAVGAAKIKKAQQRLKALNPGLTVHEHVEGIQVENAVQIFNAYDIIVDGSDNFATRYLVNDAAFFCGKPLVYGSIFQFEGQATLFHPRQGAPCYRCLFPEIPAPGTVLNCAQAGVFGALCGAIGSIQAMETLKYILGIGTSLIGQLLVIDALDMRIRTVQIKKDECCPLCGTEPKIKNISKESYLYTCNNPAQETQMKDECPIEIDVKQAKQWLDSDNTTYLLDVREPFEVDICKIEKSVNIPMQTLLEKTDVLPDNRSILIYCHGGVRSLKAAKFLRNKGFSKVTHIIGGIHEWAKQIDPNMPQY